MLGVSVEISDADLQAALARLDALVSFSGRAMFEDLGEEVMNQTRARFRQQVDPDGEAWAPSARAEAEGGKTLIDTARLMRSITYAADVDHVRVGTNVTYGAAHQSPSDDGTGKLKRPKRSFLGINDADLAKLQQIALEHLGVV